MPGLGGSSPLGEKICRSTHRCFCGEAEQEQGKKENIKRAPKPPPKPNVSRMKVHPAPQLCVTPAGRRPRAAVSQSPSATAPSRWPAAIRRTGFTAPPRWRHLSCDHLCLPPAIGQGSYSRRLWGGGRRAPWKMLARLSRCGRGTGGCGGWSATVEEWPNEVSRDGPMNHYLLGYSTFKPKMHISEIKFKNPGENLSSSKSSRCGPSPISS